MDSGSELIAQVLLETLRSRPSPVLGLSYVKVTSPTGNNLTFPFTRWKRVFQIAISHGAAHCFNLAYGDHSKRRGALNIHTLPLPSLRAHRISGLDVSFYSWFFPHCLGGEDTIHLNRGNACQNIFLYSRVPDLKSTHAPIIEGVAFKFIRVYIHTGSFTRALNSAHDKRMDPFALRQAASSARSITVTALFKPRDHAGRFSGQRPVPVKGSDHSSPTSASATPFEVGRCLCRL